MDPLLKKVTDLAFAHEDDLKSAKDFRALLERVLTPEELSEFRSMTLKNLLHRLSVGGLLDLICETEDE